MERDVLRTVKSTTPEDREWARQLVDDLLREEERRTTSMKWWEYIVAFGVVLPVLLVVDAYAALDAALRKRGL